MARPQEEELVEIASSERSMDDEVEDFDGWAEPLTPHPHQLTPEDQRRMDALQNTPFHMATPAAAPVPRARVNVALLEAESDADAHEAGYPRADLVRDPATGRPVAVTDPAPTSPLPPYSATEVRDEDPQDLNAPEADDAELPRGYRVVSPREFAGKGADLLNQLGPHRRGKDVAQFLNPAPAPEEQAELPAQVHPEHTYVVYWYTVSILRLSRYAVHVSSVYNWVGIR